MFHATHAGIRTSVHSTRSRDRASMRTERSPTDIALQRHPVASVLDLSPVGFSAQDH
jgi:hypothetical protein